MNLLIDLDGTLAEPMRAISRSLVHACKLLGEEVPTEQQLRQMIGPPLHVSLKTVLGIEDEKKIRELIRMYREHHEKNCIADYQLYQGILEVLPVLAKKHRLYLATSKPKAFAVPICIQHGVSPYFRGLHGSELDGTRSDKGELITHILEWERLDPSNSLMIGDRYHDVVGAQKNDIPCIGVLWGYGSEEELNKAGATLLCQRIKELPKAVSRI